MSKVDIPKDSRYYLCTVGWGSGNLSSLESHELTSRSHCRLRCMSNEVQSSNSLAVKTEIFRKRLCNTHFHCATVKEMPYSPGVIIDITYSEALATAVSKSVSYCRNRAYYAESKKGNSCFFSHRSAILSHCFLDGSTPVGLWAQACNIMISPAIASFSNFVIIPAKSKPLLTGSKYG